MEINLVKAGIRKLRENANVAYIEIGRASCRERVSASV